MNYELYMGEALAEAQLARSLGERPSAAVAVVDEAMVARSHERVAETNDPTAHAVVMALREAARKLGPDRMGEATIFATHEPCPMCVGALLECDIETLVYAVPDPIEGAAGTVIQLAQHDGLPRRMKVISGIRRDEAEELLAGLVQGGWPPARSPLVPSPAERCPSGLRCRSRKAVCESTVGSNPTLSATTTPRTGPPDRPIPTRGEVA
jgi:tRNA(adenine34) deaminase